MVQCHEIFDHFLGLKRFDLETNGNRQKWVGELFYFRENFRENSQKNVCLRICWLTLCRRGRWLHRYNVGVVVLEKNFKYKYLTARKIQTCDSLQTKLGYEDKSINRRQYHQADFSWAWSGTDSVRELEKIFKYKNLTARKQRVAIRYKKKLSYEDKSIKDTSKAVSSSRLLLDYRSGTEREKEGEESYSLQYCRHRYVLAVGSPLSSEEAEAVAEDNRTGWLSKN